MVYKCWTSVSLNNVLLNLFALNRTNCFNMLVTKLLGIVLVGISVALITQSEALTCALTSNQLVDDAVKAIALYNDTRANVLNNVYLNMEKALNSSCDYVETLLESLPQRLPIDSALSAIAALEEKARSLGVDISICINDNFENLQLDRIFTLTYRIRDSYTTYAYNFKVVLDAYAAPAKRYSIDECVGMEFGENACLIQLLTVVQIDISTLEGLANSPSMNAEDFATGVNSQLTTVVEDDANSFNSTVQIRLRAITQCAENIFNLSKRNI